MKCPHCGTEFVDQDSFDIHLGVGAPVFHACNSPEEMHAKGMTESRFGWHIDPSLIVHQDIAGRLPHKARLKRGIAHVEDWR